MRKTSLLFLAASALAIAGCSKENVKETHMVLLNAQADVSTRTSAAEDGSISWNETDRLAVFTGSSFSEFSFQSGSGSSAVFGAELEEGLSPSKFAVYPYGSHSISGSTLTVNMPASYSFEEGVTNSPMVATIEDGKDVLSFKHIGGVIKFTVGNVPVTAGSFVFVSTDKKITGDFEYDGTSIASSEDASGTSNKITVSFDAPSSGENVYCFYIPLPTGTYDDFTIYIYNQDGTMVKGSDMNATNSKNVIKAGTLLNMPEITFPVFSGGGENNG